MQIVIDIDEDDYNFIKEADESNYLVTTNLYKAVYEGTVLPKGHGRLIDENDLMPDSDYEDGIFYAVSIGMIKRASTIIEEDRAESEE